MNLATYFVDRHVAEGRGDRVALIEDARTCTYAELAARVDACAAELHDLGVRPGDRVLLVLADSIEFVAYWYAAQKLGAVTAEAYTFLALKDLAYLVTYTQARVVICDADTEPRAREAIGEAQPERATNSGRPISVARATNARKGPGPFLSR